MNLNDEYLLKVYLQCGDFENFKDTYLKIKRNFSNIVKKKILDLIISFVNMVFKLFTIS